MPKKYVNGYDKFKVKLIEQSGATQTLDFSFRYQALREYYEKISVSATLINGSKVKAARYIEYEWRIIYTDYIEKDDLIKFAQIENAETDGKRIILYPHIDNANRYFEVQVQDEKREIDLHYHLGGKDDTPNKGYEFGFVNKTAIRYVDMYDPNLIVYYGTDDTSGIEGQVLI